MTEREPDGVRLLWKTSEPASEFRMKIRRCAGVRGQYEQDFKVK